MAIHSHPTIPAEEHVGRRRFPGPLVVIILLVALIVGVLLMTQPGAAPEIGAPPVVEQSEWDRSTANQNDMAVYHQSEWDRTPITTLPLPDENAYHQSEWSSSPQTTLAIPDENAYHRSEWHAEVIKTQPRTLAWPPRPTQFHPAENVVMSLDENALATYHQSEWDRTPTTTLPLPDENAYHQSEWGR
ncbi:MAG: hypothetical protein DPW09_03810 [Anaerolineae bacterium]|nr:hypothetical protein [Anaerolineales bacterium]MCQ3972557.1 hypothetical protein [Anaerolineae bacterium]